MWKKANFPNLILDCLGKGQHSKRKRYCCIHGVQCLGIKSTCKGKADMEFMTWREAQFWQGQTIPPIEMWVPTSLLLSQSLMTKLFVLLPLKQNFFSFPYICSVGNLSLPFSHHLPSSVSSLSWYFTSGAAITSQSACSICGFLACKKHHYSNNRRSLSGGRGSRERCDSWFHSTLFSPQPWLQWLRSFFKSP